MSEWFGKGCEFLSAEWESCDVQADDTGEQRYKESEPVLMFCNHEKNPKDHEGNCCAKICPLGLKEKP